MNTNFVVQYRQIIKYIYVNFREGQCTYFKLIQLHLKFGRAAFLPPPQMKCIYVGACISSLCFTFMRNRKQIRIYLLVFVILEACSKYTFSKSIFVLVPFSSCVEFIQVGFGNKGVPHTTNRSRQSCGSFVAQVEWFQSYLTFFCNYIFSKCSIRV